MSSLSPYLRRSFQSLTPRSSSSSPSSHSSPMARIMSRATPFPPRPTSMKASKACYFTHLGTHLRVNNPLKVSSMFGLRVGVGFGNGGEKRVLGGFGMRVTCGGGGERGYRRTRKRVVKNNRKQKELELSVKILIEEGLPNDPELLV